MFSIKSIKSMQINKKKMNTTIGNVQKIMNISDNKSKTND